MGHTAPGPYFVKKWEALHFDCACQCVLVVEDEPSLARVLRRALCQAGYSVDVALSCKAAVKFDRSFQIGVFDIELGDGCGVELARDLLEKGRLLRLVFFTASTDHRTHARARTIGAVVSKRDGISALLEAIRNPGATLVPKR